MIDPLALARLLAVVEAGGCPPPDGGLDVLSQPDERTAAVLAFTAHNVVVADVDDAWARDLLPSDDLSAPLSPAFLTALAAQTARRVATIDMVLLAYPLPGDSAAAAEVDGLGLRLVADDDHPRVRRAQRYRRDVRVWSIGRADNGDASAAVVTLGRGLAGRTETSIEVASTLRGRGVGRALALAARAYAPGPVWAQVAPGNAASVRAFLAAGFRPVGAEVLLVRHSDATPDL